MKLGENSDGMVPLSSQLYVKAQLQAAGQFGFNTSHTGVLKDEDSIQRIVESIGQVRSDEYPQSHIDALIAGGFDVDLDASYSDRKALYSHYGELYGAASKRHP